MADIAETNNNNNNNNSNINNNNEIKPKIQIRNNGSINGLDKSPSPAAKLLINHGKPNFTIQRSPKIQENGNSDNPLTAENIKNNNYNAYKTANSTNNTIVVGTKFNGVFKPSNVTINSSKSSASTENEAAKVVLRRARQSEPPVVKEDEDENVPEFIRRQRRIQERLAKENVLDFENRRSGYFTHVMISPDSPNRTSFVETMSSPAIVPSLEMPAPVVQSQCIVEEEQQEVQNGEKNNAEQVEKQGENSTLQDEQNVEVLAEPTLSNGHATTLGDDADIAQAIEEVNKAVAGEEEAEVVEPEVTTIVPVTVTSAPLVEDTETSVENSKTVTAAAVTVETKVEVHTPVVAVSVDHHEQNGQVTTNGHAQEDDGITISHTCGISNEPSIPRPDPSGALGVNFEPKTVVSFAQELGSGDNKYPDTVKVVKDGELVDRTVENGDDNLQDMAKLKFEITGDQADVQVTHVLKTD